ncbi:MAG: L-serine ammonia-lyase, iron-sulfur-dependent subunit beta [Alphaproteobacteria bacterium]
MNKKGLFDVISPIMVGPSSSHTAGAIRLGIMARNIFNDTITKVDFCLYNSFAQTGKGHGTDKGLLAGVMGLSVDDIRIRNIFENTNLKYSFTYKEDLSRHPNSVDIKINDKMTISGESVGAGEIEISSINGFSVKLKGVYDIILLMYKDEIGMISKISKIIQDHKLNIASLQCDRSQKGGNASMCVALDSEPKNNIIEEIKEIKDVYFATKIKRLN